MFVAILKATNNSFQKGMTFCRSIYGKKVMKLITFIFEQPSYIKLLRVFFSISWACPHALPDEIPGYAHVRSVLGPNCIERLSAGGTIMQRVDIVVIAL